MSWFHIAVAGLVGFLLGVVACWMYIYFSIKPWIDQVNDAIARMKKERCEQNDAPTPKGIWNPPAPCSGIVKMRTVLSRGARQASGSCGCRAAC